MKVTVFTWTTGTPDQNLLTHCVPEKHVGIIRTNRKQFPDFMKKSRLKKGETLAAINKKQMIMKWKDKRDVVLNSAFHDSIAWWI
jgi:hypothetical protein